MAYKRIFPPSSTELEYVSVLIERHRYDHLDELKVCHTLEGRPWGSRHWN